MEDREEDTEEAGEIDGDRLWSEEKSKTSKLVKRLLAAPPVGDFDALGTSGVRPGDKNTSLLLLSSNEVEILACGDSRLLN